MELHHPAGIDSPQTAEETCARYLERLPVDADSRQSLLAKVAGNPASTAAMLDTLRAAFEQTPENEQPVAPPIQRSSMAPPSWPPSAFGKRGDSAAHARLAEVRQPTWRRWTLLLLIIGQTWIATHFMRQVLPYHGGQWLEMVVLGLFAVLFLWLSAGFWTAIMGFVQLLQRRDRHLISRRSVEKMAIAPETRTAIVMPICNEDVVRVFAGLQATYRSLAETGEIDRFDFYVLSDSHNPDSRVGELAAWLDVCKATNGFGRIFYRWRRHHIKRKSGNVADFCRRWGSRYDYMVVLDADSVMTGDCLTTLVRMMEANPGAGIIQTAPRTVGRDTLYARVQQFASRVYGPLFVAGLYYWQLGESHYWGHNAIIRIEPFMRHCALGRLPGNGALSGEILSHDFVEAALMRRAGWAVWIAYDLAGSYEESPPTLVDDLKRDRRWCYGNLMNFRLFPEPSFHPVHRAVFVTGAFSYVSAPLWFLFLVFSTVLLATHTLVEPQYFVAPNQLFPLWPQWNPERALALFSATAALLFVPKVLSYILIAVHEPKLFGGRIALAVGMVTETLISALLAPIRMIFHTQFVGAALLGRPIGWKSPLREDAETGWREAFGWHGLHMLLGLGWAGIVYWLNPGYLWWLLPIVGALILSVPISVYSSRQAPGRRLRKMRLLLIPEEVDLPQELRWTKSFVQAAPATPGLVEAAVDPVINALICKGAKSRPAAGEASLPHHDALIARAVSTDPATLSREDKTTLLNHPHLLRQLHIRLWAAADTHPGWHREQCLSKPALQCPMGEMPACA